MRTLEVPIALVAVGLAMSILEEDGQWIGEVQYPDIALLNDLFLERLRGETLAASLQKVPKGVRLENYIVALKGFLLFVKKSGKNNGLAQTILQRMLQHLQDPIWRTGLL